MTRILTAEQAKDCTAEGGKTCCIYLAAGPGGFMCIRGTAIGHIMLSRCLARENNPSWIPAEECRHPEEER